MGVLACVSICVFVCEYVLCAFECLVLCTLGCHTNPRPPQLPEARLWASVSSCRSCLYVDNEEFWNIHCLCVDRQFCYTFHISLSSLLEGVTQCSWCHLRSSHLIRREWFVMSNIILKFLSFRHILFQNLTSSWNRPRVSWSNPMMQSSISWMSYKG